MCVCLSVGQKSLIQNFNLCLSVNMSIPEGVSLYAVSEQDPGVKLQVMMTVFSPSQLVCSAITLACVQIS